MTRWLLSALLVLAMAGWVWLAHGLLWGVPPGPVRIASMPWSCAEPLAFSRARGHDAGASFIDVQTARQLARGLGTGAIDVALVGLDELRGQAFAGTPTRPVGIIECGPEIRAAVAMADTARPADVMFKAAWDDALAGAGNSPAAFRAHIGARRQAVPPAVPRFIPTSDGTRLQAALEARGLGDVFTAGSGP